MLRITMARHSRTSTASHGMQSELGSREDILSLLFKDVIDGATHKSPEYEEKLLIFR